MARIFVYIHLMRLHKPVGILLLLWPGLWALWLANHGFPGWKLFSIFILGTIITRSAGCIMNDIWDRDFDRHVARTKSRPLTASDISLTAAWILLIFCAILALGLALLLNPFSLFLCVIAALLAAIYPLVKRFSYFPQLVLGIAFAMPVLIAYAASVNKISWDGWILFVLAIIWPLFYDTAYALTDLPDDLKIGIKSTAVYFQEKSGIFIASLQALFCLGFALLAALWPLGFLFYIALLISIFLFIVQLKMIRHNKPFQAFLNNQWVGLILWLGIVGGLARG